MQLFALFALFSPYFTSIANIPYNKKTLKPLCLLRFKALLFFPVKTDNALILLWLFPKKPKNIFNGLYLVSRIA